MWVDCTAIRFNLEIVGREAPGFVLEDGWYVYHTFAGRPSSRSKDSDSFQEWIEPEVAVPEPLKPTASSPASQTVLQEAAGIVDGARQHAYGHPADNHGNTAELWTAYLQRRFGERLALNARDVCMMQILLKVSRDANRPRRDNLTDICGYARNAEMIEEEAAARAGETDG